MSPASHTHRVLEAEGQKVILLGNEAVVRGALEAGIGFASAYPGTPSSEIADTFAAIAPYLKEQGIHFEYSTNEKCAVEASAGAAFSGVKSIVSFKHFGLNVASDAIFPIAYHGVKAAMVIIVADDPGCWSSGQSEQDSRYYPRTAHMPFLEPADPQECKEFVKLAFELSEKFKVPVIVRTTTRVSHVSAVVELGKIQKPKTQGQFVKGETKWRTMPPKMLKVHDELHDMLQDVRQWAETAEINFISSAYPKNAKKSKIGIITASVSYHHTMEALESLNLKIPVLKLGLTWPLPTEKISSFIKGLKTVFIIEELEPILEKEICELAKEINPKIKIYGKNVLPQAGELRPEYIETALTVITKKAKAKPHTRYLPCQPAEVAGLKVPSRPAILCPGCPHRATFWAVKAAAGKDAIFGGDIGCYMLGIFPPNETDWLMCMGAGEGISHGVKKATNQKVLAFIGDSTFFHAGIPQLINMVYNKSNPVIIALDNRWTAMTGHQPHPGMGHTGMCEDVKKIKIEDVAKACGVENVARVNIWDVKETIAKIKEFLAKPTVSLVVADGECRLQYMRRARRAGIKVPTVSIDPEKCKKCRICVYQFGCPAIHHDREKNLYYIDEEMCWGCGVCPQVCPFGAISFPKKSE